MCISMLTVDEFFLHVFSVCTNTRLQRAYIFVLSIQLCIVSLLTPSLHDAMSLHLGDGLKWYLAQVIVI